LVTTALIQEPNFYFKGIAPAFFDAVESELGVVITARPVQVALPYIYRHKPLFCTPLFHELGHYVDTANEVVTTTLLTSPPHIGPDLPDLPTAAQIAAFPTADKKTVVQVIERHRKEYFSDLFAAMYVGQACTDFLQQFAPGQPWSFSHPSSAARQQVVDDFLAGNRNAIVDLFQSALATRGLQPLSKRFASPALATAFSQVRPVTPTSNEEVYGLFDAGWRFLQQVPANPPALWASLSQQEQERVANDLTEKSIRNRMIWEGWNAAAH